MHDAVDSVVDEAEVQEEPTFADDESASLFQSAIGNFSDHALLAEEMIGHEGWTARFGAAKLRKSIMIHVGAVKPEDRKAEMQRRFTRRRESHQPPDDRPKDSSRRSSAKDFS